MNLAETSLWQSTVTTEPEPELYAECWRDLAASMLCQWVRDFKTRCMDSKESTETLLRSDNYAFFTSGQYPRFNAVCWLAGVDPDDVAALVRKMVRVRWTLTKKGEADGE